MFSSLFFEELQVGNGFAFDITWIENMIPSDLILVRLKLILLFRGEIRHTEPRRAEPDVDGWVCD